MRQIRKSKKARLCCLALLCTVLAGIILSGCRQKNITKTVTLPGIQKEEGDLGITIRDMQSYIYDGHSEDMVWMAYGEPDQGICYMLRLTDKGYIYQKIEMKTGKFLKETFVEDRMISNVQISPGGRYISYETDDETELVLFAPEKEEKLMLHEWEDGSESYAYTWSDDGTVLFSWQNGDNYEKEPDAEWLVTRYDIEKAFAGGKKEHKVLRHEIRMKNKEGRLWSWRSVLPNADGSKVYVREEYETFSDSKKNETYSNNENEEPGTSRQTAENEKINAQNWLLIPDELRKEKLPEYSEEAVFPLKYTKAGLYYQNEEGMLCLAESLEEKPAVRELFNIANKETVICGNGDHIFVVEWRDNMEYIQISGAGMKNDKYTATQVLYKEAYQNANLSISADDRSLVVWGNEYLGKDRNSFKITELEY